MKHFNLLLKTELKTMAIAIFSWIPFTALIAFIQWFFVDLVLNRNVGYLPTWRAWYIYGLSAVYIIDILLLIGKFFSQRRLAKKWNVTAEVVYEALIVLKIHKKVKGWSKWTPEEFNRAYGLAKFSHNLTQVVTRTLSRVYAP